MSEDKSDNEEMHCALSAIALEIQKFHSYGLCSHYGAENWLDKIGNINTILKLKNKQVKLLRRNLKTACIVAKSLSVAKAKETKFLNEQLNDARNQCWSLENQKRENIYLVNILRTENQTLRDKLQCYNSFIELAYKELLNQQDEKPEDNITNLAQLQKIVRCCGQYQADYRNQVVKSKLLEQKNRFLNSKLRIVENNLQAFSQQLRNSRGVNNINQESKKDNRSKSLLFTNLGVVCSDYQIEQHKSITNLKMIKLQLNKETLLEHFGGFDLTSHFCTVKKLLDDQDTLIKDLKCLSNEVINIETFQDENYV